MATALTLSAYGAELKRFERFHGSVTIGRASASSADRVPLPSNGFFDSAVISRSHAELAWTEDDGKAVCTIRDLGSTHGTFISRNGQWIPLSRLSPPVSLIEYDVIVLGKAVDDSERRIEPIAVRVEYRYAVPTPGRARTDWCSTEEPLLRAERPQPSLIISSEPDLAPTTSPVGPKSIPISRIEVDDDDRLFDSLDDDVFELIDVAVTQAVSKKRPTITVVEDVTFAVEEEDELELIEPVLPAAPPVDTQEPSLYHTAAASAADKDGSLPPSSQPEPSLEPSAAPSLPLTSAPPSSLGKRARDDDDVAELVDAPIAKAPRKSGYSALQLGATAALAAVGGSVATIFALANMGAYLD